MGNNAPIQNYQTLALTWLSFSERISPNKSIYNLAVLRLLRLTPTPVTLITIALGTGGGAKDFEMEFLRDIN